MSDSIYMVRVVGARYDEEDSELLFLVIADSDEGALIAASNLQRVRILDHVRSIETEKM